jgi:hypothetical protein
MKMAAASALILPASLSPHSPLMRQRHQTIEKYAAWFYQACFARGVVGSALASRQHERGV